MTNKMYFGIVVMTGLVVLVQRMFKDGLSLKMKKDTYSSVLHSHTVLMELCPCERYRQVNTVLYPNNHILNSSEIIFNG